MKGALANPRFYVDCVLETGNHCILPEEVGHHLSRVLRLKEGDDITLFNGEGGEYGCRITISRKSRVEVSIDTFIATNRRSKLNIHLAMCVIKREGMDNLLARATELGVSRITPIVSDRSTVSRKAIAAREPHWTRILCASAEQCGLNILPELRPTADFSQWCNGLSPDSGELRLLALPDTGKQLGSLEMNQSNEEKEILLLVGPEGGFTEDETMLAIRHQFNTVTFGERVLRAETAPLVIMAAIYQHFNAF